MLDKAQFTRELLRVLKPGGVLVVANWNQRDYHQIPLNFWERAVIRQLLDQWSHQEFSSIERFSELLEAIGLVKGTVTTADWTVETLPSWLESIWQGVVRPEGIIRCGLIGLIKSLREVPTFLLMRLAEKGYVALACFERYAPVSLGRCCLRRQGIDLCGLPTEMQHAYEQDECSPS